MTDERRIYTEEIVEYLGEDVCKDIIAKEKKREKKEKNAALPEVKQYGNNTYRKRKLK